MLDSSQKRQIQRMHRNHVRGRQHQERTLWHGPSVVRKIIREIMRVSESFSYDTPSERKI